MPTILLSRETRTADDTMIKLERYLDLESDMDSILMVASIGEHRVHYRVLLDELRVSDDPKALLDMSSDKTVCKMMQYIYDNFEGWCTV